MIMPRFNFIIKILFTDSLIWALLIFPSLNYQNEKEVSIAISIIVAILLYLVLLCAFIKQVYRSVFYNLSKYYLIERIEALLLEIWIKQLI